MHYGTINNMKIKRTGMKVAQETNLGVYLWMLPNGNYLADTNHNMLSMDAMQGDIRAMALMAAAAKSYGYPDGQAVWQQAHKCSEEEYQEQVEELLGGKTPDVRIGKF